MFTKGKVSSYVEFSQHVAGSGWSKRAIRRKFLKQVDKADYAKSEVGQIVNYLTIRSKQTPPNKVGNLIGEILFKSLQTHAKPIHSPFPIHA